MVSPPSLRDRTDRCPGACRPWPAPDGLLVRLRLIGGRIPSASLCALVEVAEVYGDGRIHLTSRANLQLRALPAAPDGGLRPDAWAALTATGLLPAPRHELVRNVMTSPQTGLAGGRSDLRPVAAELDRLLCAEESLAGLPGRFLFVLDDGRGDLLDRRCDLGLVVLDDATAQVRVGERWGAVVPLGEAAARLATLASEFAARRGADATAPWHVAELVGGRAAEPTVEPQSADPDPLVPTEAPDPRLPAPAGALPFGDVPGGRHLPVTDAGLGRADVERLVAGVPELVITPWRGVLVPTPIEESHVHA